MAYAAMAGSIARHSVDGALATAELDSPMNVLIDGALFRPDTTNSTTPNTELPHGIDP